MPGTPQTLPVPPPVSIPTLLNAIRLAAGSGGSGGAAWGSITGTLSAQTDLQTALDAKVPLTSFTGGGILATGGFTLTVPATGTAALLGTANVFTAAQTINVTGTALDIQSAGASKFKFTTAGTNVLDVAGDGSANQFSIKVGTGTILTASAYGTTTGYLSGGTLIHAVEPTGLVMQAKPLCFGPGGYVAATLFLSQKSAATLQLGLDAAGVTNQMFTAASRITSDGVGANLTIAGGNGRGGAGGSLIFSYYTTAAAATIGTLKTALTLDTTGLLTFSDAVNMAFNDYTGTKIGTSSSQKLAFWGNSPTIRPTVGGASASYTNNGGTALTETDTWDGYTLGQIVSAIRLIGLLD